MASGLSNLIQAASSGDDDSIAKLKEMTIGLEVQALKDSAEEFDRLFDLWNEEEEFSHTQAEFLLSLAARNACESQAFRNALHESVKTLLPPYISSQAVLKAIGTRDAAVQPSEVAARLGKLQKIPSGALVSFPDSRAWGKLTTIDRVAASLGITSLKTNTLNSYPVSAAFSSILFFDPHQEMYNLINPSKASLPVSSVFRKLLKAHALIDISDEKLKNIAMGIVVPECLSSDAFETWWNSQAEPAAHTGKRAVWEARSALELHNLLEPYQANGGLKLEEAQAAQLATMFAKQKPNIPTKDADLLAECIASISACNPDNILAILFAGMRGKVPFWPQDTANVRISKQLEVWGHIPLKELGGFVKATRQLYTNEELARLACKLPSKCLSPVFAVLEIKEMAAAIFADKALSCDVLQFLWKNHTKLPKNLTSILDMDHVAAAISMENLPKEWAAAQRDLKRSLFEKADFQKYIIENADGDIPSIIDAIQKVRTFQMGECQSLMVKLSRHSDELRQHIESGEGKRLMGKSENPTGNTEQPLLTSRSSMARMSRELEDLINVQIPENVKAIAHARSYGDLSENAEYDAAKERRRYLNSRRNELENTINTIHTTDFKDVTVKDTVVLGCTVVLSSAAGKNVTYFILGALDGDPDKNRISYRTKMGEAMMGAKVGAQVKLPDGTFTVKSVVPLAEDLRKELADDGM